MRQCGSTPEGKPPCKGRRGSLASSETPEQPLSRLPAGAPGALCFYDDAMPIPPDKAKKGDVVQFWWLNKSGRWSGHAAFLWNKRKNGRWTLFGSHGHCGIGESKKDYSLLTGKRKGGNVIEQRVFIARIYE